MARVHVIAPDGTRGTVDEKDLDSLPDGARVLTQQEIAEQKLEADYAKKGTGEKVVQALAGHGIGPGSEAFLEAGRSAFSAGTNQAGARLAMDAIKPGAGKAYAEHLDDLETGKPGATTAGAITGTAAGLATAFAGGGSAGGGAARALPTNAAGLIGNPIERVVARGLSGLAKRGALGRAATTGAALAARGAAEGALIGGAEQLSKDVVHDTPEVGEKLYAAVGHGALTGGSLGGALGVSGSLLMSGLRGLGASVGRRLEAGAAAAERSLPRGGQPAEVPFIDPDAGLRGPVPAAESPFTFGAERRPMTLRPGGRPGRVETEPALGFDRRLGLDTDAGLRAQENSVPNALRQKVPSIPTEPAPGHVRVYHSGPEQISSFRGDTSFALDPRESIPYLQGRRGWITYADLPESSVASESALRELSESLGKRHDYAFEMADDPAIQKVLVDRGYKAVRYQDMGPENAYEHATVRILGGEAKPVGHARVSPSGRQTGRAGTGPRELYLPRGGETSGPAVESFDVFRGIRRGVPAVDSMKATGARVSADVAPVAKKVFGDVPSDAFEPLTRSPNGYKVRLDRFVEDGGKVELYGNVHTADGGYAGEFGTTFSRDRGKLIAKTDNLLMDAAHQGKGAGSELARNLEDAYRKLGVDEIQLHAAQVGRYTWAKAGYEWSEATGREMESSFRSWLAKNGHDAAEAASALRGPKALAESPHGKAFLLSEDAPNWYGRKTLTRDVYRPSLIDPDAGLAARDTSGRFQGAFKTEPAIKPSSRATVPRDVDFDPAAVGGGTEAANRPISIPRAEAGIEGAVSTRANPARALAQEQAWKAAGGGQGLQTTRYAKQAQRYFPNGEKDLGEIALRTGIVDMGPPTASPMAASWRAGQSGTPAEMLARAEAVHETMGRRIGDLTEQSGARISPADIDAEIGKVRAEYAKQAGREHMVDAVDAYRDSLLSKLALGPDGKVRVQDVLEQRKYLDQLVYEEAKTLDPKGRVKALREVRAGMENMISDALDAASGKSPGELRAEYARLKKDFHGVSILKEALEDSAARAAKAGTFGLSEKITMGLQVAGSLAHGNVLGALAAPAAGYGMKLLRERGNAAAAAFLARAAEQGTISSMLDTFNRRVKSAASTVLREGSAEAKPRQLSSGVAATPEAQASNAKQAKAQTAAVQAQAQAIVRWAGDVRANPAKLVEQVEDTAAVVGRTAGPTAAMSYTAATIRAVNFVMAHIPVKDRRDPLDPMSVPPLTREESRSLIRATKYALQPMSVYDDFARGVVTPEGIRAAQTLTPDSFVEFQEQLWGHVEQHMLRQKRLSQTQRLNVDKLLGFGLKKDIGRLQADFAPVPPAPPTGPAPAGPTGTPVGMKIQQSGFDAVEARLAG